RRGSSLATHSSNASSPTTSAMCPISVFGSISISPASAREIRMFSGTRCGGGEVVPEIFTFSDRLEALLYFPIAHWDRGLHNKSFFGRQQQIPADQGKRSGVAGPHVCSLARFGSVGRRRGHLSLRPCREIGEMPPRASP